MALQGVIKSMPSYVAHHRASVTWPREGREFIVADEKTIEAASAEARKLHDERRAQDPEATSPEFPVVYHVPAPTAQHPGRAEVKRGRIIDIPSKPVVMDEVAYQYIKEAFGTHLSCEPLGGAPDAMAVHEENARLREEVARLKAKK